MRQHFLGKFTDYENLRMATVRLLHELKPKDFGVRILNKSGVENCYLKNVIFSDEATFYVSDYTSRHNCRFWGAESSLACYAFVKFERRKPRVTLKEDGAPSHWGSIVRAELDKTFPYQSIGRMGLRAMVAKITRQYTP
ncbi:hypothetical protein NPIL_59031 [Nephila pilipes]|uniref:Uncharacterized protein n=1 Tax=Nephila pilipes TaxID=299642 RepID=A0A8X6QMT7_NEPPI|nr:hypothetical protein NPIL_59031 [Nephila pilipes]